MPVVEELERRIAARTGGQLRSGSSNLTVIVTNQTLNRYELKNLCKQVHSSLVRAIHPFHTVDDNDVCYAVSTAAVEKGLGVITLGLIAAELAWDALLVCAA